MTGGILIFIAAILVIVMVHESGHFLVAKLFDFKAPKFFVGFGPTLWSFKRGETEYGVKAFPLGGFVKIVGMSPYEDVAPEDEPRSYPNKPAWQRALLLVAGSATHWVLAFVVLVVTLMTIGVPHATNRVAAIERRLDGDTTPAARAGIRPGDRIVAVGGRPTSSWDEIRSYIRSHERGTFTIERDGARRTVEVELGTVLFGETAIVDYAPPGDEVRAPRAGEEVASFLGVTPEQRFERLGPISATRLSGSAVGALTYGAVRSIGEIGRQIFSGELWEELGGEGARDPANSPVGIVGASRLAGEAFATGRVLQLIEFLVGFTVLIGLLNLLPLPPLDGGHLAVLAIEKIRGRPVDVRKVIPVAAAVISFLLVLTLAVLYLDLVRPVESPF